MPRQNFSHIDTWVFDLDNTLYPPRFRLFDQIEKRMVDWVMGTLGVSKAEADRLRSTYWALHGTTLAGLMAEHNIEPDPFLEHVHDIDFTVLEPDAALAGHIRDLPGRKIVYTNGSAPYAEQVLQARGLSGLFDAVYGIEHANYRPKPEAAAFDAVFKRDNLRPETAAMFEDDQRNLAVPHAIGMRTIHVAPEAHTADHIHHHTVDLTDFLSQIK
ncbi:pyrimidine 5'-nucleotidase [Donghicola mangrovi]|uniref:Pyrimidine 5'-nucleotidase n=1 Tax=Donghicola mangrovi TaxID=2729614 RepID=A0A850Q3Y8_9RHOB|nr:pyrimidine 5'-nucleotidase [Donghicola mangrovi]NVO23816.1 pyrimidine 5'-nucleotidase [Donghicola mangrovi]